MQRDGEFPAARRSSRQPPAEPDPPSPTSRQRLDYIADMVQELRHLALQAECRTLYNLLELARREAVRCRDRS